jgi:hypothetical protein
MNFKNMNTHTILYKYRVEFKIKINEDSHDFEYILSCIREAKFCIPDKKAESPFLKTLWIIFFSEAF